MNVGTGLGERRVRVWVRDVFAGKDRNIAICAMDIFLCN